MSIKESRSARAAKMRLQRKNDVQPKKSPLAAGSFCWKPYERKGDVQAPFKSEAKNAACRCRKKGPGGFYPPGPFKHMGTKRILLAKVELLKSGRQWPDIAQPRREKQSPASGSAALIG